MHIMHLMLDLHDAFIKKLYVLDKDGICFKTYCAPIHVLHKAPSYPALHPDKHVPLVWWQCVWSRHLPHVSLHMSPYVPKSHSEKKYIR